MHIRTALVTIVFVLFFWNLIVPSLIDDLDDLFDENGFLVSMGFILGTIVGQGVLLALWGALGMEPAAKRILRSMSLIVFGCLAWIIGFKLIDDRMPLEVSVVLVVAVLVGFCVVMMPLLVIRRFTNWSIYRPSSTEDPSQFAIRDLFLWTTVIAVQIALAKIATRDQAESVSIGLDEVAEIGLVVLLMTGGVVLVGLPTAFAAFGKSRRFIGFLVAALFLTPLLIVEAVILLEGGRPPANDYFQVCLALFSTGLGIITTMVGILWIVRRFDYRLGTPGYQNATPSVPESGP